MQTVELFSDLVVVVAIHAISDALADKEHAVTMKDWIWFFTHVFFLWYVWFGVCFFANIAHMFTVAGKFECIHYVIILASMAVIVTMVKAVSSENHKLAIGMAFAGRLLLETCILCEIFCRRAPWVEPDKKKLHKDLAVRILVQVFIEMLPFIVVGLVFSDTFHDIFPFTGSLGTMIITAINMRAVAFQLVKHSQLSERDHTDIADLGHLEERYELIVLIFLGELCFSAVAADGIAVSLAALWTAFGCYLHYFLARSNGQKSGWNVSPLAFVSTQELHILLFFAVPAMGVGFVKGANGEVVPALHISACAFLLVIGGLDATSVESGNAVRLSNRTRAILEILYAAVLAILSQLLSDKYLTFVVPVYLVGTALLQIWFCQDASGV